METKELNTPIDLCHTAFASALEELGARAAQTLRVSAVDATLALDILHSRAGVVWVEDGKTSNMKIMGIDVIVDPSLDDNEWYVESPTHRVGSKGA